MGTTGSVLVVLVVVLLLSPVTVVAETDVYFQNNCERRLIFNLAPVDGLSDDEDGEYQTLATSADAGMRVKLFTTNRDTGIKDGTEYIFETTVVDAVTGQQWTTLLLKLVGSWVNSDMWCSVEGDEWYDDDETHMKDLGSVRGGEDGHTLRVVYRAFTAGVNDDVEFIFMETQSKAANLCEDDDCLNLIAWNIYMRPRPPFFNGQLERAPLIANRLVDSSGPTYDVIVFSEAWTENTRETILGILENHGYSYHTDILASTGGLKTNGGVIIVSRYPILNNEGHGTSMHFSACDGSDCLASKGVVYARIQKGTRIFHVFGTHLQAWKDPDAVQARAVQLAETERFVNQSTRDSPGPVIICGDMNVDKEDTERRSNGEFEYSTMIRILGVEEPPTRQPSHQYTADTNRVNDLTSSEEPETLDYVLVGTRVPADMSASFIRVRMMRSTEEWKEFVWEHALWDLSDHFPVAAHLQW